MQISMCVRLWQCKAGWKAPLVPLGYPASPSINNRSLVFVNESPRIISATTCLEFKCSIDLFNFELGLGSGGGSVGRAVASDTRDLRFEFCH